MDAISGVLLGVVQGLTEFLPISSSGHLVLFQNLLGFRAPELLLDASLHAGTLLAVCVFFRKDLVRMASEALVIVSLLFKGGSRRAETLDTARDSLVVWVVLGNIPTALIGLLFREELEGLFASVRVVGVMLLATGVLLALTALPGSSKGRLAMPTVWVALAVGIAQGLAIIPGISRSGATIACGLLLGMERDLASRYSFLLSLPAIAGALLLQAADGGGGTAGPGAILLGGFSAALVGLAALKLLVSMVRRGRLAWFAPYCWAAGAAVLFVSL
jgi:undecaprenyl-diphosphatase